MVSAEDKLQSPSAQIASTSVEKASPQVMVPADDKLQSSRAQIGSTDTQIASPQVLN